MKKQVQAFFSNIEDVWSVIPSYVKVFIYSVVSSCIGLYFNDGLNPKSVIFIVVSNLGLYQIPRSIGSMVKNNEK